MPDVSVIIPCFNAARFLNQAINSVAGSRTVDSEIIVIDDGSTDCSNEIIQSWGTRIRAVSQSNLGASAARNRGTRMARGKYIQYLDADDLLTPRTLEKRVATLESTKKDVAYCDWQYLVEGRNQNFEKGEIIERTLEEVHSDPELATFSRFWSPPAALMYRHDIVRKIGTWNESLPVIQDARFLFDAAAAGAEFVHVTGVGAYYRRFGNSSLSRRSGEEFVDDVYKNACQIAALWRNECSLTDARRQAIADVFDYVAREYFEHQPHKFKEVMERKSSYRSIKQLRYCDLADKLTPLMGRRATLWCLSGGVRLRQAIQRLAVKTTTN